MVDLAKPTQQDQHHFWVKFIEVMENSPHSWSIVVGGFPVCTPLGWVLICCFYVDEEHKGETQ